MRFMPESNMMRAFMSKYTSRDMTPEGRQAFERVSAELGRIANSPWWDLFSWSPRDVNRLMMELEIIFAGELTRKNIETAEKHIQPTARSMKDLPEGETFNFDAKQKKIIVMSERHGWRLVDYRPTETRLRFKKGIDDLIDVWTSKMTVASTVTHPKRGRTPLYRRKVTMEMLEKIFINPRLHTGEGYYQH